MKKDHFVDANKMVSLSVLLKRGTVLNSVAIHVAD